MNYILLQRDAIKRVAIALGDMNERVLYVGGAVVSFYINDPAADDIRPTKDVDIILEIASVTALEKLRVDLNKKGFTQTSEDDVICRFRYDDMIVDVMGTKAIGWAPGNKWFEIGFKQREAIDMDGILIYILPLPYYLATKFSAFHDRGENDARTSHDFEDITYILDNQTALVENIILSPEDVQSNLQSEFKKILNSASLQEAMMAHLSPTTQTERFERMISNLHKIVQQMH